MNENTTTEQPSGEANTEVLENDDRQVEIESLRSENQRLREQYTALGERTFRRTALGLGSVGILAAITGIIIQSSQQVLFVLAGIGLFAAVLTWVLTPEQFIPLDIGDAVYDPFAQNCEALTSELGLSGRRIYVETNEGSRLYIPEGDPAVLPEKFDRLFITHDTSERSGVSLQPIGSQLMDEFERTHRGPLPDTPAELATHLIEGIVEGFELASGGDSEILAAENRIVLELTDVRFGSTSRFDHPIQSLFGVGFARGLDVPIEVQTVSVDGDVTTIVFDWGAVTDEATEGTGKDS